MLEPYPVVDVEESIDWEVTRDFEDHSEDVEPTGVEPMGSKEKFWYRDRKGAWWLFKYPRGTSGEHWAEKVAAEVAGRLGVPHCSVELAIFDRNPGTVSQSFVDERLGEKLFLGNQALDETVSEYDPNMSMRQLDYSLENILRALDEKTDDPNDSKRQFAEYVVLDAVIGNTDRHHENWGILRTRTETSPGWTRTLAPSFDHASSLGRELSDDERDRRLCENRIGHYAERGSKGKKGRGIHWSSSDERAPSPLELVRLAARGEPDLFRPAISRLEKLDDDSLREIVNRVPDDWMSSAAREFSVALMRYTIETMREMR